MNGNANNESALVPFQPSRLEYEIKYAKENYIQLLSLVKTIVNSSDYLRKVFFSSEVDFDTRARKNIQQKFGLDFEIVDLLFDELFSLEQINPEFNFTFLQIDFTKLYSILNGMESSNLDVASEAKAKRGIAQSLVKEYLQVCINFLKDCITNKSMLPPGDLPQAENRPRRMTPIERKQLVES